MMQRPNPEKIRVKTLHATDADMIDNAVNEFRKKNIVHNDTVHVFKMDREMLFVHTLFYEART